MDDPERIAVRLLQLVRVVEPLEDLHDDEQRDVRREPDLLLAARGERLQQVTPVHVLHRDVVLGLDLAEVVDLHDVGMSKRDAELRFLDEHPDELLVVRKRRKNTLDDDTLLEAFDTGGSGQENLGHSARTDAVVENVVSESVGAGAQLLHQRVVQSSRTDASITFLRARNRRLVSEFEGGVGVITTDHTRGHARVAEQRLRPAGSLRRSSA
jgi:hypothetical protein